MLLLWLGRSIVSHDKSRFDLYFISTFVRTMTIFNNIEFVDDGTIFVIRHLLEVQMRFIVGLHSRVTIVLWDSDKNRLENLNKLEKMGK